MPEHFLTRAAAAAVDHVIGAAGLQTAQKSPLTGQLVSTHPGAFIAAPSLSGPDYRFVWDRDGAIAAAAVVDAYLATTDVAARGRLLHTLANYVAFVRLRHGNASEVIDPTRLKVAPGFEWAEPYVRKDASAGLGEARQLPDGCFDPFIWSRPQPDGAAMRARTLVKLVRALDHHRDAPGGDVGRLLTAALEAIRVDLDYTAATWRSPAFDLWEETLAGKHYYTREVQAAALADAAKLTADGLDRGILKSALQYAKASKEIVSERTTFWNGRYLAASVDVRGGDGHGTKTTDLDANVILAAIYSGHIDSHVLATANTIEQRDTKLFPLNADCKPGLAPAIGRYQGDVYQGGNPFYLLTLAFAELHYRVAENIRHNGLDLDDDNRAFFAAAITPMDLDARGSYAPDSETVKRVATALIAKGDAYINRVRKHAAVGSDGSVRLPEQLDRVDGAPRSAPDLTWSSAALVSAAAARTRAAKAEPKFPFNFQVDDVLHDAAKAKAFVEQYFDHEAAFFKIARDATTGLAFDGIDLDPATREIVGPRRLTAPSKECADVAVLTKILTGNPLAKRLVDAHLEPRAEALRILQQKIDSYDRWDRDFPGFGGFMPWIKVDDGGSVEPADEHWWSNVPSLDNAEWIFTLLALEPVLRDQGEIALADRYKALIEKLANNVRRVFYDEEKQAVRVQAKISDARDPNATYTSHEGDAFMRGLHGVHEGAMILHFMCMYANPPLSQAQKDKIWNDTAMVRKNDPLGTTWEGWQGSPHEEWEFLIMPKRDQQEWKQLFRIRQKLRTLDGRERDKPGFGASINAPESGRQDQPGVPYAGDHGIPRIAHERPTDYPFYAIYGVYTVLLEQADTPEHREGIAWLLNTLRARNAVTSIGAGESVTNDGTLSAPLKTIDGSMLNWIALMGGLEDEVRARLKSDGTYDSYQETLKGEYRETFGTDRLFEPAEFAAPNRPVPWVPAPATVSALTALADAVSSSARRHS